MAPRNLTAVSPASSPEGVVAHTREQRVQMRLHLEPTAVSASDSALVYRVAQKLIRKVTPCVDARSVRASLQSSRRVRPCAGDDGRGFIPGEHERRREEGHIGLTLLYALVADAGSQLSVLSASGQGNKAVLTVPAR